MPSGAARTWIVTPELFDELLLAVHEPDAVFDLRFRREVLPALAGDLESTVGRCV
jgi:hypothetical protein